jgi:hypothetical protein
MKSRCRNHFRGFERLESRDVPGTLSTIDVDGDLVTIATSKGTDAQLAAVLSLAASGVPGGQRIDVINLAGNAVFDGTNLTVTAKRGPLGGDGLVNVGQVLAAGLDLGTVTIDGGLIFTFKAGKNTPASTVKAINVHSVSGTNVWQINASVGSIRVATDLADEEIHINGPNGLGKLSIGGSLIGNPTLKTGYISVPNGKIGSIKIGGDIRGGTGSDSGEILAHDIGAVTIGGSLIGAPTDPGGGNTRIGVIESTAAMGRVRIGGDIRGGALGESGMLSAGTTLAGISVGGSLLGGPTSNNTEIHAANISGKVNIGGDIVGFGFVSGIVSSLGSIGAVSVGGSLRGGPQGANAQIGATSIGSIKIAHDLVGGGGNSSGLINVAGVGSIRIGGSVRGGDDVTGFINVVASPLTTIRIAGDLVGGTVAGSGILNVLGDIGVISIGGSVIGGLANAGYVHVHGTANSITIGKNLIGSASFPVEVEATGNTPTPGKQSIAIKNLSIGGRVENALIAGGVVGNNFTNPDAQIGTVKVGGDWIASNLVSGVDAGLDTFFGTNDDHPIPQLGEPDAFFSKIGSITIRGQVEGAVSGGAHFGFVAQEIGAFSVNGVVYRLAKGRSNDTSTIDSHLMVGATFDVTIHEV